MREAREPRLVDVARLNGPAVPHHVVLRECAAQASRSDARTRVAGLTFNTTVMNFRRREMMCPESGGSVRLSTADGRTVTVTFTATATATVSGSGGRTGTVPLYCGM